MQKHSQNNNMDTNQARFNMLTQQIRSGYMLDDRVLELLTHIPRELFVPKAYGSLAFADINIPIGYDQVMMTPNQEARLLQALAIKSTDNILEIGTGTGYLTSLLAKLGEHVHSIDIYDDFIKNAEAKLAELNITNVHLACDDAARGWVEDGRYDVIAVTGALPILPKNFLTSLHIAGRLFIIVGQKPAMSAFLITRIAEQKWDEQRLFETDIPELINAIQPEPFIF